MEQLTGSQLEAEKLKNDGKLCFKKEFFAAAIEAYTGAITLWPDNPVYFTNRALCHHKRHDWTRVEEDCRTAINLDHSSVKGHYLLGLALLRREHISEGVRELEKAMDLGRGADPNGYMVEEIWQELAKAKYMEWEQACVKRSWESENLREACEQALKQKHFLDDSDIEGFSDEAIEFNTKQLEGLRLVFKKVAENDAQTEVPDHLCCKIMLDILRDPVITPSGVTYERSAILDHLEKVGNFDPVTREPLHPSQLTPNLAIKEAVQAFLDKHGWAYKTD